MFHLHRNVFHIFLIAHILWHNNYIQLRESGWRIIIVWGCVFKGISNEMKACLDDILLDIISTFLQDAQAQYVEIDRISCLEIRNKIPLEG